MSITSRRCPGRSFRAMIAAAIIGVLAFHGVDANAVLITSSFGTGPQEAIAISRDPVSGNLYIFNSDRFSPAVKNIEIRTTAGTLV